MREVTIRMVASAAGVSTATVSRVLTGRPGAGNTVRDRVLRVAAELGYSGNSIARSLRVQRTGVLGLVVPDIMNPFFPALVHSMEEAIGASGRAFLLADAQSAVDLEARRVTMLLDRRVDGMVISPTDRLASASVIAAAAEQVPVVQIDRRAGDAAPHVGVDQFAAMAEVLSHLRDLGRSRFAFIGYDSGVSTSEERLEAFLELAGDPAAKRVLREEPERMDIVPDWWIDEHAGEVDAIVATSDLLAVSLQLALRDRGFTIPDDIAIVSFDNTRLAAAAQLTSVEQPLGEMARQAVALLDGDRAAADPKALATRLVVRSSTRE